MAVDEGDGLGPNQTMMMGCHIVLRQLFRAASDNCRVSVMSTNETARYF